MRSLPFVEIGSAIRVFGTAAGDEEAAVGLKPEGAGIGGGFVGIESEADSAENGERCGVDLAGFGVDDGHGAATTAAAPGGDGIVTGEVGALGGALADAGAEEAGAGGEELGRRGAAGELGGRGIIREAGERDGGRLRRGDGEGGREEEAVGQGGHGLRIPEEWVRWLR